MEKKLTFKEKIVNKAKAAGQFVKDNWLDILIITTGSIAGAALGRACYNLGYSDCKRENFTYDLPDWASRKTTKEMLDYLYDPEFINDGNHNDGSILSGCGDPKFISETVYDEISKYYNPDDVKCRAVIGMVANKSEV